MTKPIPLDAYVVGGLVTEETVNAILACRQGEPMVTESTYTATPQYRVWTRARYETSYGPRWTRNVGQYRPTVQAAAEDLLGRLVARAQGRAS